MDLVGSGTGDDVGGRAETVAEFGVGVMGEDAEFGNRIDGRLENETAVDAVEVVGAVDKEIVGLGTLAVHGISLARTQRAAGFGEARSERNDARLEET